LPLTVFPIILTCWLCCRERITLEVIKEKSHRQDVVVRTVENTVANVRLISDCNLGPMTTDAYELRLDEFNEQEGVASEVVTNNLSCTVALRPLGGRLHGRGILHVGFGRGLA